MRQAIVTGRYVPGETLPTILEWSRMLGVSIRVPEDVRVVTMSNWGLGPVCPVSLTRLEMNPYAHGDALAQMALDYLAKGTPLGHRSLPLNYIGGDSFV